MKTKYRARRITKERADRVKRSEFLREVLLLNTANGYIIIEPAGTRLGDGPILSVREADYELQAVWYPGPVATLREARTRLGLGPQLVSQGL